MVFGTRHATDKYRGLLGLSAYWHANKIRFPLQSKYISNNTYPQKSEVNQGRGEGEGGGTQALNINPTSWKEAVDHLNGLTALIISDYVESLKQKFHCTHDPNINEICTIYQRWAFLPLSMCFFPREKLVHFQILYVFLHHLSLGTVKVTWYLTLHRQVRVQFLVHGFMSQVSKYWPKDIKK